MLKKFIKYVSQNMLGMVGMSVYILADTYFISVAVGADGITALNLVLPIYNIIFAIGAMMGVGSAIRFVVERNKKSPDADGYFFHALVWAFIISLFFIFVGLFLPDKLIALLGGDAQIVATGKNYTRIFMCFAPFFMFNNVLQNFIRNDGAPRLAMTASLLGNLFNIIFDYVFIFPCKLGMLGAALATGISPVISMLILMIFFFRKKNTFRLEKTKLSLSVFGEIISLGLASFIAEFGFGLVMMLINKLFKSLGGDTAVAAFAIVVNVFYVINAIFNGISAGTQPIISFSYGQHDFARILQVLKYALITIGATAAVLYVILFFSAYGIAAIFNTEKAEDLQKLATTGIKLYFISSLFSGFNLLFSSYFSASDKGICSQIITLLRGVVLIIPLAYLFAHLWKITGLWLATPAAEMLTLVAAIIIFFVTRKKRADAEIPAPVSEQE